MLLLLFGALLAQQHEPAAADSEPLRQSRSAELPEAAAAAEAPTKPQRRLRSSLVQGPLRVARGARSLAVRARASAWSRRDAISDLLHGKLRLAAFTSEMGEAFRPIMKLSKVRAAYAVSWLYVLLDVLLQTSKEAERGAGRWRVARTSLYYAAFHTFATMAIPALAVHQTVTWSASALHASGVMGGWAPWAGGLAGWAPTFCGLALIPALPVVDNPLHRLLDSFTGYHRHPS